MISNNLIRFKFLFYTDTTSFLAMPQPAVRKIQKAQLQSFALAGAPKARTAYALFLRDQYPEYDQAGLTNRQRISSISRSWKVLSPDVKDKYRGMALEESKMRQKHIVTKINERSMPLSSLSEVSENEASSVATLGNFVLESQPQIGELLAARHKVLQWQALVKLNNNKSSELQILRDICSQPKFRGTGVMQPIEWDDSSCSPRWNICAKNSPGVLGRRWGHPTMSCRSFLHPA